MLARLIRWFMQTSSLSVQETTKSFSDAGIKQVISVDNTYFTMSEWRLRLWLRAFTPIFQSLEWKPEKWDCDDYAEAARMAFKVLGVTACGLVNGWNRETPHAWNRETPHAWNVLVTSRGDLIFFEPHTMQEAGPEYVVDNIQI